MIFQKVNGHTPKLGEDVFLAENCVVVGDVELGTKCSVWYNAVIRGDVNKIKIGSETNIQDGAIIHGTYQRFGTTIGKRVTIGHMAMLHGCDVDDLCLIGMSSIIMDGAKIGARSIVGAGSLVTEGSEFPPGSLVLGRPAKKVRDLKPEELKHLEVSADHYLTYSEWAKDAEDIQP